MGNQRKEHQDKAKLTTQNVEAGNIECAPSQINKGDGGLAKNSSTSSYEIDGKEYEPLGRSRNVHFEKF